MKYSIPVLILLFFSHLSIAQFYNGLEMDFGKNRVQYNDMYWAYFRFDKFDAYFHPDSRELAEYASEYAFNRIKNIEDFFEYTLERRIIFIVYSKHSYFKQSNIGLDTGEDSNIGGGTRIIDNKVFLFYEGDHRKFEQQIRSAIAEVMINEMLYGGNFKDKLASSTIMNLPDWYVKGLISYVSDNWSLEIENHVKDNILNGEYKKFNHLEGEEAVYAGHSLWRFIANSYGKSVIPNILYLTKINRNYDSGFLYVLGSSLRDLTPEWLEFYLDKYETNDTIRSLPEGEPVRRAKKNVVYQNLKISPDGKYAIYSTNEMGKFKIFIVENETGKRKKIMKRGHKLEQITDYSYPVMAWHPTSELFAIITEEKGNIFLYNYFVETGEIETRTLLGNPDTRKLFFFDKILDFSYSHDGLKFVISATKYGQTDLFVYNIASNTTEQITMDIAEDFNPRFINNSSQIIFSSNRLSDTLMFEKDYEKHLDLTSPTFDVFIYDYKNKSKVLQRISDTKYINESLPFQLKKDVYTYLSDENGIRNRYVARFDSTISHIDTTTHYRYFTKAYPVTNYKRNILEHHINPKTGKQAEILFNDNRYRMYSERLEVRKNAYEGDMTNTNYRAQLTTEYALQDSLRLRRIYQEAERRRKLLEYYQKKAALESDTLHDHPVEESTDYISPDSVFIDINNYLFEKERRPADMERPVPQDLQFDESLVDTFAIPKPHIYQTSFYINQLVSQLDFNFLNASYQAFTGGAVYFNPGGNMLFKVGAIDLFEDYKITGGARLSADLESNEYLISIEDLKDRVDKQYIFHRQAFNNYIEAGSMTVYTVKTHTHEFMYVLKYPFSQITALKGTASLRYDRNVVLATDFSSLNENNYYKVWGGLKLEYIFDNTIDKMLNIKNGTRFKIFGEYYQEVNKNSSDLWVVGADFRHYQKIHRNLIFAARFAASTSFGKSRLIYYLGGVDNWMNLSRDTRMFIPLDEMPINREHNYAYQTVATNMRGFSQNIRNGNSFALINTELRWPIIRYFVNRPINSDFLNNFQVVGFFDIGSAWSGTSPMSDENAYNTKIIENGPITIIIDQQKTPFVAGFGYGVRSRLLGYFIRLDWAWGVEGQHIHPRMFYLSLSLDF